MAAIPADALISVFDRAPLNRRYWLVFGLLSIGASLDFFDFFIVGSGGAARAGMASVLRPILGDIARRRRRGNRCGVVLGCRTRSGASARLL
jgi:hypothetical protein